MSGDRERLGNVVTNLVTNAIRYNREGGRVEVALRDGVLTVADTGIGIPEKDRPHLFERFYRVDRARSREQGGSGLGLAISTAAQNQVQAMQMSFLVMLPSILLSGFMFPRENMPYPIYLISHAFPVTYFIQILRGIILRGAGMADLTPWIGGLSAVCVVILAISIARFHKSLD